MPPNGLFKKQSPPSSADKYLSCLSCVCSACDEEMTNGVFYELKSDPNRMVKLGDHHTGNDSQVWVQRVYKPVDLLRICPDLETSGRTITSFASREVVVGTRLEQLAATDLGRKVEIFSFDQILHKSESPSGDFWFFRQMVEDDGSCQLSPCLDSIVVAEIDRREVENPDVKYNFCESRLTDTCRPGLLFPSGEMRAWPGHVLSGYELFVCPGCQAVGGGGVAESSKQGGLEWLNTAISNIVEKSQDERKNIVVDKFFSSLKAGMDEVTDSLPLRDEGILRRFAINLEQELSEIYAEKPREYKSRVFTLNFNLSDKKNSSLRRRIFQGQFSPKELTVASSEELASDDLQEKRKEQRDRYFSTQVLKRKEEETLEPEKKQKTEIPDTPPSVEVDVPRREETVMLEPTVFVPIPEFAAPPLPIAHQNDMLDESMQEEEDVTDAPEPGAGVDELRIYADQLKQTLQGIESESARIFSINFVDHIMRHVSS